MELENIRLTPDKRRPPRQVMDLLKQAQSLSDDFYGNLEGKTSRGFVPSDFPAVYDVLSAIREEFPRLGNSFLEWGSGVGAVTLLAASLGYEAIGIELDAELLRIGRDLAGTTGLDVRFEQADFLPAGCDFYFDGVAGSKHLLMQPTGSSWDYPTMELNLSDFDVVYVFPYPTEMEFMMDVFAEKARSGALMVVYMEDGEFEVYRKPEES